jgi:hypothetical protein
LAWLNATPDTKTEGELSRRGTLEKEKKEVEMPECDAAYILDYLFDLGITEGDKPLSHSEIESWQRNIGIELQSFEVRFIRRLSVAYLHASHEMKSIDAETPWEDAPHYMSASYRNAMRVKAANRKILES